MGSTAADRSLAARLFRFKERRVQVGKMFQFQSWNFLADEMFDRIQGRDLVAAHERERVADVLRAPCASYAMHIIFRMLGHIVINDVTYSGNVESARCDIGGNHHFVFAALES